MPAQSVIRSGNFLAANSNIVRRSLRCNDTNRLWYIPDLHPGELIRTLIPERRRKGRPGVTPAKVKPVKNVIPPNQGLTQEDKDWMQQHQAAAAERARLREVRSRL
jgi:hypothetical protein